MEIQNIQPSFEIERFLEKFENTKRAYFKLIGEKSSSEVVEEIEDDILE